MKEVLESIIKIEEELKNKSIDAQKEAENIINKAKEQINKLEKDRIKDFEDYKQNSKKELNILLEEYQKKLFDKVDLEINKLENKILEKKEEIIRRILKLIIK